MGPVAAGNAGVRSHHGAASSFSRSRGIPSGISGNGGNINLSNRADAVKNELKPVLPQNRDDAALMHTHEVYSDDDGDVIIDLEEVKMLDDMAPDALKREQVKEKVKKVKKKDKKGKGKDVVKKEPVNVEIIDGEIPN
jgi:DNA-directed RNA polymerase III subunit RPC4